MWANSIDRRGYDVVLLGLVGPSRIDIGAMEQHFQNAGNAKVSASLIESGFRSPFDLLATNTGSGRDLQEWLAGAVLNTDRNLRLP